MRSQWYNSSYRAYDIGGGRGLSALPRAVKWLLITNVALYIINVLTRDKLVALFGVIPTQVLHDFAVYQLITYMFLHGSFLHILFNMLILWMFAPEIELTWGTRRFLNYYFLTGIAGGLFTVAFQPNAGFPTIGASGAIYGILVAYAVMFPDRTLYLFFLVPMRVKYAVMLFVGLEFLFSLSATADGVGHLAHLGGAAVGFLYLKLDWRVRRILHRASPRRYFWELQGRHRLKRLEKDRQKTEEVMRRVDEILDKINAVGINNISDEERKFLGDASEILSRRDK
jgi:membrane associated rhomboid family serine protease